MTGPEPDSEIFGFQSGDPMFHTHADDRSECTWHLGGDQPHSHVESTP